MLAYGCICFKLHDGARRVMSHVVGIWSTTETNKNHAIPKPNNRQQIIEKARQEIQEEQAKRRVSFALRHTAGPKAKEISQRLVDLPSGSPILLFRTSTKKWEGRYKFISVDGETAVIQLNKGRKIFRSTCVKPWVKSALGSNNKETLNTEEEDNAMLVDNLENNEEEIDLGDKPRK